MDFGSRREDRWVGHGHCGVLRGDSEIEVVWKVEAVCVFGCGWKSDLFAESVSVSVSGVMRVRLQQWSAFKCAPI